ncbi:MAG: alpha/beta hydrolase [Elusimicrobia bacterium]|nr:alpha/beta hydrolase [Elusimicrobiota bacterium]
MLWSLLISLTIAYGVVLALVYVFQSRLVYFPEIGREAAGTPLDRGLAFEPVVIATADGEKLSAWWVPAGSARGTALIFHGNAGNISHRIDYLAMFHRLGYSSLIIDYRGYGRSTGSPSEDGTYRDAQAAWRWLTAERGVKAGDVVLLGESLGGAVAAWLAARVTPRALVLASVLTSAPGLGAQVYPFLPVRLISRFSYDTLGALKSVNAPVLVAHSPEDDIIPFTHGRTLYEAAKEPKQFIEMSGGHNDGLLFTRQEWVAQLSAFLERAAATGRSRPDKPAGTDIKENAP